ncbi:MAG: protein translocase subunit SecD [Gemmataceae bacterium]|nr:protein translocase subunit SecD [Gemmataceae bacterium]
MRPFLGRILICLIPVLLSGYLVALAGFHYETGTQGLNFRPGVDLVGGTILVYEVDVDKFPDGKMPENYKPEDLAAAIKRRIDPNDLFNVTIRPVSKTRVEIILPTGGEHRSRIEEEKWQQLLNKAQEQWPTIKGKELDITRGDTNRLASKLEEYKVASPEDIQAWIKQNYASAGQRQDLSGEQVQRVKELIAQVGSLEFRILANSEDDKEALRAAKEYIDAQNDTKLDDKARQARKSELENDAEEGRAPRVPDGPDGGFFDTPKGKFKYAWVELGKSERQSLGLDNASETNARPGSYWQMAKVARDKGEAVYLEGQDRQNIGLLYSRKSINRKIPLDERNAKKYEYFLLTRLPKAGQEVTGQFLVTAKEDVDKNLQPAVAFQFNNEGGNRFYETTSNNRPTGGDAGKFYRHLAIILDGQIMSAPRLNEAIRTHGQISGKFSKKEVDTLVNILRSGALPATLKPLPVSENTIGATLGEDTITAGTRAVGLSFVAVLIFMVVYYRFSGLVACVALFANLLMTIAFMVLVNATFTLPGLAGLVLMLGMAVDANVLIYERLREERDRGASIALAIRNGYDRAFPTIIDTHLSSIFTAIVLYTVGNDQLKGFGVSLTVGLIISLFTSLYMTRLMFDIFLAKGILKKLSMFRLLSKTNIDFMRIRYYWFAATLILTFLGITIFLIRGKDGLNIDFVGGTAYGGQLAEPMDVSKLRGYLGERNQEKALKVVDVQEKNDEGTLYQITYDDGQGKTTTRTVELPNKAAGNTPEERKKDVADRAKTLPDWSVEQIFLNTEPNESGQSRFFTVRTSEKASDLVQVVVARLLRDDTGKNLLKPVEIIDIQAPVGKNDKGEPIYKSLLNDKDVPVAEIKNIGKKTILTFTDYASPGYVKTLLEREFRTNGVQSLQPFDLNGKDKGKEGRHKEMELNVNDAVWTSLSPEKFKTILGQAQKEFGERPPTERLENFDSQLAAETQGRAMYAIAASWAAILLYLWFRFGNWTFGLAAVMCLMHDLFFTLGIIAFCHYLHVWMPGFSTLLGIQDFKIDLPAIAALLTLVGYSVNDTIVVFDRIREVRGKNPELTPQMINESVNQTLSRTLLTAFTVFIVVIVLYIWGGEGVHLFAFVMVVGVVVGTYSSIYIASPLLLIFGEGTKPSALRERKPQPEPEGATT